MDTDADGVLDVGDTDITTYTWDYRNRLTAVATFDDYADYSAGTSSSVVSYTYDYANRLIGRTLDADGTAGTGDIHETVYSYDGDQIALQFDKTYANGSASDLTATDLSHRYVWDSQAVDHLFGDENVADAEVLYALTDHQGTVRDLASYDSQNDVTTIANHRVYGAYGNVQSETNSAVDCLFGYTGRLHDEASGLQNNLNRWYDAGTGRWMSQDPIGFAAGDANVYRYCGNEPIDSTDPQGLEQNVKLPDGRWMYDVPVAQQQGISASFYDASDPGLNGTANADALRGMAETQSGKAHSYPIVDDIGNTKTPMDQALAKLEELKGQGINIQDLYINDHGAKGIQEFGKKDLTEQDLHDLGVYVNPNGMIILNGCNVGCGPSGEAALKRFAKAAGRRVRGRTNLGYGDGSEDDSNRWVEADPFDNLRYYRNMRDKKPLPETQRFCEERPSWYVQFLTDWFTQVTVYQSQFGQYPPPLMP